MNTLRVLIIDDEPLMRTVVRRALERHAVTIPDIDGECRFAVEEAESAEAGLALIEASPPDIVLLDHQLPGMSGVELLGVLWARQPAPEFLTVMMTAYATLENAVLATKRGAEDFLAKPFTPMNCARWWTRRRATCCTCARRAAWRARRARSASSCCR
jgi:two-component system sensor histidine kinase/response regulator